MKQWLNLNQMMSPTFLTLRLWDAQYNIFKILEFELSF
jgi:hypothetical protein